MKLFSARSVLRPASLLLALSCVGTAAADTLYRCKGAGGETAYTSSRSGYTECKAVPFSRTQNSGSSGASTPSAATTAPASPPAEGVAAAVEFRSAGGAAEPKPVSTEARAARVMRGAVYKYEREGVTHYTNRKPAGQSSSVLFTYIETCFACAARPSVDFGSVALNTTAYAVEIAAAAAAHGVDEALVRAVIHAESSFNANALSHKGAQGLMQLMPATAARFGVSDAFTVAENINGGVTYLAWLLRRFDGDVSRAVAGYNAGEGAVDRFGGIPPYEETQRFVERVGQLHQRYGSALAGSGQAALGSP
jgi:soluble lytic murein transglycosylase-like protein